MKNTSPKNETIDEFLARGGKVERLEAAPNPRWSPLTLRELEESKKKPGRKIAHLPTRSRGYQRVRTPHMS